MKNIIKTKSKSCKCFQTELQLIQLKQQKGKIFHILIIYSFAYSFFWVFDHALLFYVNVMIMSKVR